MDAWIHHNKVERKHGNDEKRKEQIPSAGSRMKMVRTMRMKCGSWRCHTQSVHDKYLSGETQSRKIHYVRRRPDLLLLWLCISTYLSFNIFADNVSFLTMSFFDCDSSFIQVIISDSVRLITSRLLVPTVMRRDVDSCRQYWWRRLAPYNGSRRTSGEQTQQEQQRTTGGHRNDLNCKCKGISGSQELRCTTGATWTHSWSQLTPSLKSRFSCTAT